MDSGDRMRRRPGEDDGGTPLFAELERAAPPPWQARLQDFCAGAILPAEVVVISAFSAWTRSGNGDGDAVLPPLLVFALDARVAIVAPAFGALLDLPASDRGSPGPLGLDGSGTWSVLDGPEPQVKLAVETGRPAPARADFVLPATPLAEALCLAAAGTPIGFTIGHRLGRLRGPIRLDQALRNLLVVRAAPAAELTALIDRHGWRPDTDEF